MTTIFPQTIWPQRQRGAGGSDVSEVWFNGTTDTFRAAEGYLGHWVAGSGITYFDPQTIGCDSGAVSFLNDGRVIMGSSLDALFGDIPLAFTIDRDLTDPVAWPDGIVRGVSGYQGPALAAGLFDDGSGVWHVATDNSTSPVAKFRKFSYDGTTVLATHDAPGDGDVWTDGSEGRSCFDPVNGIIYALTNANIWIGRHNLATGITEFADALFEGHWSRVVNEARPSGYNYNGDDPYAISWDGSRLWIALTNWITNFENTGVYGDVHSVGSIDPDTLTWFDDSSADDYFDVVTPFENEWQIGADNSYTVEMPSESAFWSFACVPNSSLALYVGAVEVPPVDDFTNTFPYVMFQLDLATGMRKPLFYFDDPYPEFGAERGEPGSHAGELAMAMVGIPGAGKPYVCRIHPGFHP